jgi:DNA-directed RNA polymerase subunit M/transcription elongation factor TFIIS
MSKIIHPSEVARQHARNKNEAPMSRSFKCAVCGEFKHMFGRKRIRLTKNAARLSWACLACAGAA